MTATPRVVSLLPSATEIICLIRGGQKLLRGRSHECNYPSMLDHLPMLTGQLTQFTTAEAVDTQVSEALSSGASLYTLDEAKLAALQPSVIVTQDLCNVCSIDLNAVLAVASSLDPQPAVVSLNPRNLQDVLADVQKVGDAIGLTDAAREARESLERRVQAVDARVAAIAAAPSSSSLSSSSSRPSVAFVEWPNPIYVGGHWTPQLIERAGGTHPLNPCKESEGGGAGLSFPVTPETLCESDPDLIVVSPCGLDLAATRREYALLAANEWWRELRAVKAGRVALVDGDAYFNRPGPRLVHCLEWFAYVLHDGESAGWPGGDFPCEWVR